MVELEAAAADVIDAALMIHRRIGPGLLESAHEAILAAELTRRGHQISRQQAISFAFNGLRFDNAFRIDLIVNLGLIVEIKSVERLAAVHTKQLLTYLRLMEQPLGLLINFGGETLREGLKRVVNNHIFAP
ncbi:GxxExxY protein [Sphingomonas guangdongensis]|uniref:GxxExxY protein n=1 Tax=Sphingomonas guangdongensis TaxID=1141890 RepID=A0A285QYP2_9SPHN|nr:GxxExxY protein [Sphingomonas guangdongensis]SOB87080.1 GxxExxY protein [Sphingomonas guangdongensis]